MRSLIKKCSVWMILIFALGACVRETKKPDILKPPEKSEKKEKEGVKVAPRFTGFSELEITAFKMIYAKKICHLVCRVDFFNGFVPAEDRIASLYVMNDSMASMTVKNDFMFGDYWFKLKKEEVGEKYSDIFIDVIAAHEFGHIAYMNLPLDEMLFFAEIYDNLEKKEINKFKEGRHLEIPLFGHPEDGSEELFASAFAIIAKLPYEKMNLDKNVVNFVKPLTKKIRQAADSGTLCQMWW